MKAAHNSTGNCSPPRGLGNDMAPLQAHRLQLAPIKEMRRRQLVNPLKIRQTSRRPLLSELRNAQAFERDAMKPVGPAGI
jgi:hypothetical protein